MCHLQEGAQLAKLRIVAEALRLISVPSVSIYAINISNTLNACHLLFYLLLPSVLLFDLKIEATNTILVLLNEIKFTTLKTLLNTTPNMTTQH
jgi:hypothetical protein